MLFLANENFPGEAVEALRREGHDVVWVRIDAPGISDEEVLMSSCSGYRCLQQATLLESQSLPYRAVRIGLATFL